MASDEFPTAEGPWSGLPRLAAEGLALERRVRAWGEGEPLRAAFAWLRDPSGLEIAFDRPEVELRPAALTRSGLVAQLRWPRLRTRLAIGVEVPIVHAVVDRLLGFDRPFADARLQTTPVEWGIWTYLIVRSLEELTPAASPFRFGAGPYGDAPDLSIDRVGPSPFDVSELGDVRTIRWAVRVGAVSGAIRLWLPASLAAYWAEPESRPRPSIPPGALETASAWRAVAGRSPMPMGLRRLRVGAVLPLFDARLVGTPDEPAGAVELSCVAGDGSEYRILAELVEGSSGRRARVQGPLAHIPPSQGAAAVSAEPIRSASPVVDPLDAPVTLTVELGRVSLPLSRLADLKPGDVLELSRRTTEPVEITSNGRTVARGDLVLIDSELGVRVTGVFL